MNWLYLGINLAFTVLALVAVFPMLRGIRVRPWLISTLLVGLLTLVFDNLIVGLEIVGYNPSLISGLKLGFAPIEDFGYLLTGSVLVPALWQRFGKVGKSVTQIGKD
jgi:lycopene cyclase domain-containing protein